MKRESSIIDTNMSARKAVEEAKRLLSDVESVGVKEGLSTNSALLLPVQLS